MKPIETNTILNFADFRKYSDTFVETGSAALDGVKLAKKSGFSKIITVEAKDTYHFQNINKLDQECAESLGAKHEEIPMKNCILGVWRFDMKGTAIILHFGMSQDKMHEMIKDFNKPMVFFLDAHVSGPNGAGHDDYMEKGNDSQYAQDNVITAELKIILAHRKDHIILIDDQNGLNDENKKYMEMILEANPNYEFSFYDEKRGDDYYKNKCLACIPK